MVFSGFAYKQKAGHSYELGCFTACELWTNLGRCRVVETYGLFWSFFFKSRAIHGEESLRKKDTDVVVFILKLVL